MRSIFASIFGSKSKSKDVTDSASSHTSNSSLSSIFKSKSNAMPKGSNKPFTPAVEKTKPAPMTKKQTPQPKPRTSHKSTQDRSRVSLQSTPTSEYTAFNISQANATNANIAAMMQMQNQINSNNLASMDAANASMMATCYAPPPPPPVFCDPGAPPSVSCPPPPPPPMCC